MESIVWTYTPWSTGLRPHQLDVVSETLDGTNFLYIDATSSGRSCVFSMPLKHDNKNPDLFAWGFRMRAPGRAGNIINNTNEGLGHDQVRNGIYLIL
jgi:hypothetical protein